MDGITEFVIEGEELPPQARDFDLLVRWFPDLILIEGGEIEPLTEEGNEPG